MRLIDLKYKWKVVWQYTYCTFQWIKSMSFYRDKNWEIDEDLFIEACENKVKKWNLKFMEKINSISLRKDIYVYAGKIFRKWEI